jgi:hypothetical protein
LIQNGYKYREFGIDILYIFPGNKKAYFKVCSVNNYILLGYYTASSGHFLPTFRFEFTTTNIADFYSHFLSLLTMELVLLIFKALFIFHASNKE